MEDFNEDLGEQTPGGIGVVIEGDGGEGEVGKPVLKGANNGKRAERLEAKKKRKDVLESGDFESLFKSNLLTFTTEGKLKIKPASAPGWLSVSDKAEDAPSTNQPTPFGSPTGDK
jgi:hypothetical protein